VRNEVLAQLDGLVGEWKLCWRVFDMTYDDGAWTLMREDPDFHQRFIATLERDRIDGRWEASEDAGNTWRKDFDLIFERRG
jgi:hypothetical protein